MSTKDLTHTTPSGRELQIRIFCHAPGQPGFWTIKDRDRTVKIGAAPSEAEAEAAALAFCANADMAEQRVHDRLDALLAEFAGQPVASTGFQQRLHALIEEEWERLTAPEPDYNVGAWPQRPRH